MTMKRFLISAALGAMIFAGGVAVAQSGQNAPSDRPDRPMIGHGPFGAIGKDGKLTKAELTATLDRRFAELDLNHDGKITPDERAALRQKHFDARFAEMDTDHDGQLSKAEFGAAMAKRGPGPGHGPEGRGPEDGPPMHRHGIWDGKGPDGDGPGKDKDGDRNDTVTRAEFMARPLAMFDRADTNKDGIVTADEARAARPGGGEGRGWGKRGHGHADGHGDMPPPPPAQ
jgi:hypothetical protein